MSRFKKGEITQESFDIIMHDLGCLALEDTGDNAYHLGLLKGNLRDIFGIQKGRKLKNGKSI